MRNLCVILADQLNQEISSLNDFNKDLDEILICELKKNFNDNNHHKYTNIKLAKSYTVLHSR